MSLHDRLELEAGGRTTIVARTRWQRMASGLAGLCIAAGALLDILGLLPRGLLRVAIGLVLLIAAAVPLIISFASPPLGARVVGVRDHGPDVQELVGSIASRVIRRISHRRETR